MQRKNCLVKLSGDVIDDCESFELLKELSQKYYVVVITGGGTQINKEFAQAGFVIKFGPMGREIETFKGRQLARDVLERNQSEIQDKLLDLGINSFVEIPVLNIGGVLCHINGDQFLLTAYNGFDVIYVMTTKERADDKRRLFAPYPKIKVIESPYQPQQKLD